MRALGLVLFLSLNMFSGRAGALDVYPNREKTYTYVIANGAIVDGDVVKLRLILDDDLKRKSPTVIYLSSQGGALDYASDIAALILSDSQKLYQATRQANMVVINDECSSACAVLMTILTGKRDPHSLVIMVTPSSKFGLHAGAKGWMKANTFIEDKTPGAQEAAMAEQIKALRDNGINPEWMAKRIEYFQKRDMTPLTAQHLCSENVMIIPPDSCLPNDGDVTPLVDAHYKKR
jgi:hypothetical protein